MNDQAYHLRQMAESRKKQDIIKQKSTVRARTVTITSGKGGVGKSNLTINLALALAANGQKVLVLDADFGLANIDVLLGITPKYNLSHVIQRKKNVLEIVEDGPNGIKFISGGSGIQSLIHLTQNQLNDFIMHMEILERAMDFILIDTGAGLSDSIMKLVLASDETILVTTPEPTAIMDAYALVKTVISVNRNVEFHLIVNKAESIKEAENILNDFTKAVGVFLKFPVKQLGYILSDTAVGRAVKIQHPFLLSYPNSPAAKQIMRITDQLLDRTLESTPRNNIRSFFQNLLKGIRK